MTLPLADQTVLDLEVIFLALDGPDAEADLRGLEVTAAWFNEISEIPKAVVDFACGRIGRYPATSDGGPTWFGLIADTNPPDSDSWLYRFAEEETPSGWEFYKQPGGVVKVDGRWVANPEAENLRHLPENYYVNQLAGRSEDWVKVYLGGQYGFSIDGRPVYPEWRDSAHVALDPLEPIEGLPLYIGLDFGLTPAAVFAQRTARGQWRVIDELITEDMGVMRFSELLAARLAEWYPHHGVEAWGDPAGAARAQTDERTCLDIVREYADIPVRSAPTNEPSLRREAVAGVLNRMVDGEPGFQLSPHCTTLRKGFSGGYCFRRVQVAGAEKFTDKPDKNKYSHPHDALQYLLSGAGEARVVMRRERRANQRRQIRVENQYEPLRW
jgi:hypothetical protein